MAVESSMLALGTPAPSFTLPQPATGATVSLDELTGPALVVTFICNHCPYVQHVAAGLATLGRDLADQGVPMVGISSNDVVTYPQDGPDQMVAEARRHGWTFPYLYDETQDVARAFSAACTPDTFVFDGQRRLVYRGQLDDSRPGNGRPVTAADVRAAVRAAVARPGSPAGLARSRPVRVSHRWDRCRPPGPPDCRPPCRGGYRIPAAAPGVYSRAGGHAPETAGWTASRSRAGASASTGSAERRLSLPAGRRRGCRSRRTTGRRSRRPGPAAHTSAAGRCCRSATPSANTRPGSARLTRGTRVRSGLVRQPSFL